MAPQTRFNCRWAGHEMAPQPPQRLRQGGCMARHRSVVSLVLAALILALPSVVRAQGASSGESVIAFHVTIAPSWFDPSTAPAQITPFGVLYALHDSVV